MRNPPYRSIFWFILLLLGSTNLPGQGWERTYGTPLDESGNNLATTPDGGFILIGTATEADTLARDILLIKTDATGTEQWRKTYGNPEQSEFGNAIQALQDGYVFAATSLENGYSHMQVYRTDLSGQLLWSVTSPLDSLGSRNIAVLPDGFAITGGRYRSIPDGIGGTFFDTDLAVWKIDDQGAEDWLYTYGQAQPEEGFDLFWHPNQSLYVTGFTKSEGAGSFDGLLLRLDASGDLISSHTYGDIAPNLLYALAPAGDTALWMAGQRTSTGTNADDAYLVLADTSGQELLSQHFPMNGLEIVRDLKVRPDGRLLLTGEIQADESSDYDAFLLQVDQNYDIEWIRRYGGVLSDGSRSLLSSANQEFTLVGFTRSNGNGGADVYLIHTDSLGNSFPSLLFGTIYQDLDFDCLPDTTPTSAQAVVILEGSNISYLFTDANGAYNINLDTGDYQVYLLPPSPYWTPCWSDTSISVIQPYDTIQLNGGLQPQIQCPWMQASISTPFMRRCFPNIYVASYQNLGTEPANPAFLEIELDPYLSLDSASMAFTELGGNTFRFELGTVAPFEGGQVYLYTTLDCDSTLTGQTHCVSLHAFPDTLCLPVDPGWDGSSIELEAACLQDSVRFTIRNVGQGNMNESLDFFVIEDQIMGYQGNFQLPSSQDTSFIYYAGGSTMRLETQQSQGHPIGNEPAITVEGCGDFPFSTGFVLQFPQDDPHPWIDVDCQESIGSFDPNDKLAFPRGYTDAHYIEATDELEYLIRFQNTGTDTAFLVVIQDTLSPYLDPATVQPGAASHPYQVQLEGSGVLRFVFEDILLPDSSTNELRSHGFVKFRVRQFPDNAPGTLILNRAGIYFDFNAPIITNQTYQQVENDFIIIDLYNQVLDWQTSAVALKVYPNPSQKELHFEINESKHGPFLLQVIDAKGQVVYQHSFRENAWEWADISLAPGFYFFTLSNRSGWKAGGKLVLVP